MSHRVSDIEFAPRPYRGERLNDRLGDRVGVLVEQDWYSDSDSVKHEEGICTFSMRALIIAEKADWTKMLSSILHILSINGVIQSRVHTSSELCTASVVGCIAR